MILTLKILGAIAALGLGIWLGLPGRYSQSVDEIEQTMVELTPMARLGEVEDIALGALYLCSNAASYVTGDILCVNGGMERLNMQMPRAWGGSG